MTWTCMNYYDTTRKGAILNHFNIENYAQNMVGRKGRRQIGHSDMILFIQILKFQSAIVEGDLKP